MNFSSWLQYHELYEPFKHLPNVWIDPDAMYRSIHAEELGNSTTFLYTKKGELHIGEFSWKTHGDMMYNIYDDPDGNVPNRETAFRKGDLIGRSGFIREVRNWEAESVLNKVAPNWHQMPNRLVSFWNERSKDYDILSQCIAALEAKGLADNTTIISTPVHGTSDIGAFGKPEKPAPTTNTDFSHQAASATALHLGAWPDGRRLTDDERTQLMKSLGRSVPTRKGWPSSMSQFAPGRKWWAVNSETTCQGF